jgi:hypothetical protein
LTPSLALTRVTLVEAGGRFDRRGLPALIVAALAVVAAATAFGSNVPVTLKLIGAPHRDLGQAARLTATARLPAGARLLIQRSAGRRPPVKVAECPRSPCTGSYRDAKEENVSFQALAIRRNGARTTILGRSKRITVAWAAPDEGGQTTPPGTPPPSPPPSPSPSPAVTPGHYEGKTADGESFRFDIAANGRSLTNLQTGQINETCDPPAYLSGGNLTAPGPYPVGLDGSFTISATLNGMVSGSPSTIKAAITGRISAGAASGTYRVDTSFTAADGTGYNCSSGNQTWTASKPG